MFILDATVCVFNVPDTTVTLKDMNCSGVRIMSFVSCVRNKTDTFKIEIVK